MEKINKKKLRKLAKVMQSYTKIAKKNEIIFRQLQNRGKSCRISPKDKKKLIPICSIKNLSSDNELEQKTEKN